MTTPIAERVNALQEYIRTGRILEAMDEFYAPEVEMRENGGTPTKGLAANIEREKQFLAGVKEWKGYTVRSLNTGADTSAVEAVMEFTATDGTPVRLEQVAVQTWKDGKIVSERFYYDASRK